MIRCITLVSALLLSTSLFAKRLVLQGSTCKLFLLTSEEYSADEPLGGLQTWDQEFKKRFENLGYIVQEVRADQLHHVVESRDLVLNTMMIYEHRERGVGIINSRCYVKVRLEKVTANHGDIGLDLDLIQTASSYQRFLRRTPNCTEPMKDVIKKLPACVH